MNMMKFSVGVSIILCLLGGVHATPVENSNQIELNIPLDLVYDSMISYVSEKLGSGCFFVDEKSLAVISSQGIIYADIHFKLRDVDIICGSVLYNISSSKCQIRINGGGIL